MELALERDSGSLCICPRSATVWERDPTGHVLTLISTVSSIIKGVGWIQTASEILTASESGIL